MKVPRDVSGRELAKRLKVLGYELTRQSGSHLRLTTTLISPHHITIPDHEALRLGTLISILNDVAEKHHLERDEIVELLFKP
jgi:predicted RNA binding protein YcfA (HicA-like mRNA interferase family)